MSKDVKSKIAVFLKSFGNDTQLCYNSECNRVSRMVKCDIDKAVAENNAGKDVYFYINAGGTKQNDIKKLTACFVDLDAGRGRDNKYLLTRQVDVKKRAMLLKIKSFPLKPSYVVETRNGYQVYWLLAGNHYAANYTTAWNAVQNKINNFFKSVGSDVLTKKINQIYRVPFLMWRKEWEGKQPFYVSVIMNNKNKRYTIANLASALQGTSAILGKRHGDSGPKPRAKTYRSKPAAKYPKGFSKKTTGSIQTSPKCPPRSIQAFREELADTYSKYDDGNNTDQVIKDTVDFLLEVKQILWYCKKQFMSNAAERLANELSAKFCV